MPTLKIVNIKREQLEKLQIKSELVGVYVTSDSKSASAPVIFNIKVLQLVK